MRTKDWPHKGPHSPYPDRPDSGPLSVVAHVRDVPTADEQHHAHNKASAAEDEAETALALADLYAEQKGRRSPELDADAAELDAVAHQLRAAANAIDTARDAAAREAQAEADAGRPVDHYVRALSPMRTSRRPATIAAVRRSTRIRTAVPATRRARTCGGGRPAARPARRSTTGAGSSGDDPSSPGDEPPPAPDVGSAGRLTLAHILKSRRHRLRLRARLRHALHRRPIGGAA